MDETAHTVTGPPATVRYLTLAGQFTHRLAEVSELPLWAVSRVADDVYTVLTLAGPAGVPLPTIGAIGWSEALCFRMWSDGGRSTVVADVQADTRYSDSDLARHYGVRAYAGVPIVRPSGELMGTLCGFGASPMTEFAALDAAVNWLPVAGTYASILAAEFGRELERADVERAADWRDIGPGDRDPVTALPVEDEWLRLLNREEVRSAALAEPVGVVAVSIDGDTCVSTARRAAGALLGICGAQAQVAHTGPGQFGVLCPSWPSRRVEDFVCSVDERLAAMRIRSRSGWSMRHEAGSTFAAWAAARRTNAGQAVHNPPV